MDRFLRLVWPFALGFFLMWFAMDLQKAAWGFENPYATSTAPKAKPAPAVKPAPAEIRPPAPVVEVRPAGAQPKQTNMAKDIGSAILRSSVIMLGVQVMLGAARVGLAVIGVPIF